MPERSTYLSDAPSVRGEEVVDDLRFSDFRPALVEILTSAQTPLTVGVFGPWGSGKTSLLKMLRHDLERLHPGAAETVWFTAWKYDRHEALWRAFILRVLDALQPEKPAEKAAKKASETYEKLKSKLDRLEQSVYREVEWKELGRLTVEWSKLLPEAGRAAGELAAALFPGGKVVGRILRGLAGGGSEQPDLPEAASAIRREIHEHFRAQLSSMEQFEETFQEAVELALKGRRLVVFVDDLDRCLPEKAIEVLEAIKLFLEVPGTEFVLGMDAGVVERGIEVRYGKLFPSKGEGEGGERQELPITGSAYLQKIVQIPFHLPALAVDDLDGFIEGQDKTTPPGTQLDEVTRGVVARGVLPNPRQVKRTLNILRLLRGIARTREEAGGLTPGVITDPLLAKTVLIQIQWPELYREWRIRPPLVQTLEKEYQRLPASEDEISLGRGGTGEGGATETPRAAGGLLGPYLADRRRYALLERMLAFPPPEEAAEEGARRARFAQLDPAEMEAYTRLAGALQAKAAAGEEAALAAAPADLMTEMLSGDRAKVDAAVARVRKKEPDGEGPLHEAARRQLAQEMVSTTRPAPERAGAGYALGLLGDPRFDPKRWHLPDDALAGFSEIAAGEFQMGSKESLDPASQKYEQPMHPVDLPTFWMARFPVTAQQFRHFATDRGASDLVKRVQKQESNHPVVNVTWHEALAYSRWLGEKLESIAAERLGAAADDRGRKLWQSVADAKTRAGLPSEAEWEKAAQWTGEESRVYPWGNDFSENHANTSETGLEATSAVGCFPAGASPYGCEDMSGNVWEWTRSLWGRDPGEAEHQYPYVPNDGREALDASDEVLRVVRGGSFAGNRRYARCADRGWDHPHARRNYIGFRVVLSPFFSDL